MLGPIQKAWTSSRRGIPGIILLLGVGAQGSSHASADEMPIEPAVREALAQKTEQVRACYRGNVVSTRYSLAVHLSLDAGGRVVEAQVRTHGRFIPASREACVVQTLRGIKLPPTERRRFIYVFKWGTDDFPSIRNDRHQVTWAIPHPIFASLGLL